MKAPTPRPFRAALAVCVALGCSLTASGVQTDLDAFMEKVIARRDDNWKKLQQYVLDERETIDVRGPGNTALWGERREYTWFIRDGFFVRSPLKFNGVTIGEDDRRKYEADFLRRQEQREKRRRDRQAADNDPASKPGAPETAPAPAVEDMPADMDAFIKQTRQPEFISSAYFLRFKFESGKYALVGREKIDGRDLLRIEYYPARLFSARERDDKGKPRPKDPYNDEIQRVMNKVSLVTLWIEPSSHQIVKFTFDNIALDFLPAQWLVRLNEMGASMTMGQPFPDVWLPRALEMRVGLTLALGDLDVRYNLDYHDYRRADVTSKLRIPGER